MFYYKIISLRRKQTIYSFISIFETFFNYFFKFRLNKYFFIKQIYSNYYLEMITLQGVNKFLLPKKITNI